MDFADAPRIPRAWDPFADLPGVYAGGRDFGAPPPVFNEFRAAANDGDVDLSESGVFTPEALTSMNARVANGELAQIVQRTWQEAITSSFTLIEVTRRLGIGRSKLLWMVSVHDLFAFVADGELRFPAWQFTEDPLQPVLPHLSRLVEAFADSISPTSMLGFMRTPHGQTQLDEQVATPVEWLIAHGDVERLVTILNEVLW